MIFLFQNGDLLLGRRCLPKFCYVVLCKMDNSIWFNRRYQLTQKDDVQIKFLLMIVKKDVFLILSYLTPNAFSGWVCSACWCRMTQYLLLTSTDLKMQVQ